MKRKALEIPKIEHSHLLVARRATYLVDGRFLVTFFGRWRDCAHTHESVQLMYMVHGNIQGGGGTEPNIGKLRNFENLQIAIKVSGSIGNHIGSSIWQPS